jgi:hypothetical protein
VKSLKFAVSTAAVVAVFALLAACSTTADTVPSSGRAASASEKSTPTPTPAPDLTGTWKQSNSHSADNYQQATITGSTIAIDWVADNGATTSVYWAGSFTPPTAAGSYSWTSENDTSKTSNALLASSDPTKDFSYENGVISYQVSALGTTTTVELKRK